MRHNAPSNHSASVAAAQGSFNPLASRRRGSPGRRCDWINRASQAASFSTSVLFFSLVAFAPVKAQDEANDPPPPAPEVTAPEVTAPDFGKLPWDEQQDKAGALPARRLGGPREMLDLYGIDASQLATFNDGEALGPQDEEAIVRLLYQMARFPLNDIARWAKPPAELPAFESEPLRQHGNVFRIQARATRYVRVDLLPEVAERFEFEHYFIVDAELSEGLGKAAICTRAIPASWRGNNELDEPISALAFLLKVTSREKTTPAFAFAAHRVAWHPRVASESRGISPSTTYLASQGMDVGLFDAVRRTNKKPMSPADRECFYQLFAAVNHAHRSELKSQGDPAIDLAALLQKSSQQHGRLMMVRGTARRAMAVRVDDDDIRERFGIEQYYQLDIFIPLRDQEVRIGHDEHGDAKTFTNSYPVTVCVLDLPPDLPASPDLREEVAIPAAFFKLWAYHSQFVSSVEKDHLQVSPMFIGAMPVVVDLTPKTNPYVSFAVAGGFALVLAGLWFALWRSGRSDSRFSQTVLKRQHELQPGESLDDAELAARDGPDFSNLD